MDHPDFHLSFAKICEVRGYPDGDKIDTIVREIISNVRKKGDIAIKEYTHDLDSFAIESAGFAFSDSDFSKAESAICDEEKKALNIAAERISTYCEKQKPQNALWTDDSGVRLGWKWTPIKNAGLYIPGGLASYPSSVLMSAILAKTAGVQSVVMCTPTPHGAYNPLVLFAAKIAEVDVVYRIGGAQAIAAMAYGTETIPAVDKIFGPGNAYVASAKKIIFGQAGIDMIAGPSELLVIADKNANPDWIASDLLSQAEHDEKARSILITDTESFGRSVLEAINQHFKKFDHKVAKKSWDDYGCIIIVKHIEQACALSNNIAPEHVQLCVENPEEILPDITDAGAIFLGYYTPEAIGDYIAGPSHVLPTRGAAKFSSGLSCLDFMKRISIIECSKESFTQLAPQAEVLALSERLVCHAQSLRNRMPMN